MMTRSELAERAEVNAETIRYYENRGLLPQPRRSASGYRLYNEDDVARLAFVKRAQDLGFSLSEIAELVDLRSEEAGPAEQVRVKAREKMEEVDRKIRDLRRIREELAGLISACAAAERAGDECPILRSLDGAESD